MKTKLLIEALELDEAQTDAGERVIRNVVLIRAGMSKNRRYYSEGVLQKAVSVFEGAKAYANHPTRAENKERPERSVRDITGWYANVRYTEGALRADRYFTRTQAGNDAWAIAEDILSKRAPATLAGLSINAVGTGQVEKFEDGEALRVESISQAVSVDDVSNPAAGGGYVLTAGSGDELMDALMESLTFEEWFASRPEYVKRLQKEMQVARQDGAVKAAKAEAGRLVEALEVAQKTVETLEAEREAARLKEAEARRELGIERALAGVNIPAAWKADLREQLKAVEPEGWAAIIEREIKKAKAAGAARVPVTGAGQRVNQPVETATGQRRIDWTKINTPEEMREALAALQR